uniref:Uncharacterized protein n=1 Tax=Anguilla anguilla TaxID=7936 RepID=A0A0E9VUQ5_ANGAN
MSSGNSTQTEYICMRLVLCWSWFNN